MRKTVLFFVYTICLVTITAAQNVGIGTTAPAEKLQVAGNIKADTLKPAALKIIANAGAGKLLTSDAAGNASWQASTSATANGTVGFGSWGDCSTNNISEYLPVTDTGAAASEGFGFDVAQSGNFAIIGVPGFNNSRGCADVYQFNGSTWVFMQKLTDPSGTAFASLGFSVSISGNFAIAGALSDSIGVNQNQGSACIFQYNGTSWELMQKITDPGGAAGDFFGFRVSISGNNAIIGSNSDDVGTQIDQGSASIFHFNGTSWNFAQKITDPAGLSGDNFGTVSISGNFAIVGAQASKVGANIHQGNASIFQLIGNNWVFVKKITDPNGLPNDLFGGSVSISGNYAIVGAIAGDGTFADAGAAFIFHFDGTAWTFMQKLTDPTGILQSQFGSSVCISGPFAIVGDKIHTSETRGTAMVFIRVGLQWETLQTINDPYSHPTDRFGVSVSIDETTRRFAIGANQYSNFSGKVVFGKF